MSTMTVALMSGETHASLKALEGYCWFHRLFLEIALRRNSDLAKRIDTIIADFIRLPSARVKKSVPSSGEFLPLLSVTEKFSWEDVMIPYFKEHLDRYPSLLFAPRLQPIYQRGEVGDCKISLP